MAISGLRPAEFCPQASRQLGPRLTQLIPIGTVVVVVATTSLPARLATRIHTADVLRYE
jgi:ABC-type lipoprotein release transport system permease subunit